VETAEVRYVYRPVENLLLVLVTNRTSNIVEDLETLRLFACVLSEYCPGEVDEASVCKNAFELTFAFDEIVAQGHKENVTMRDIQVNVEMESHEEKLANMIRKSKEDEAKEEMKRRVKTLARENRNKGVGGGPSASGMGSSGMSITSTPDASQGNVSSSMLGTTGMGSDPSSGTYPSMGYDRPATFNKPVKKGTGMQLGKPRGGQNVNLLQAMAEEGEVIGPEVGVATTQGAPQARAGATAGIQLSLEEKVCVTMSRDGGLQGMEVKGDLQLLITDQAVGKALVPLKLGENSGYQFKTHPNINKQRFSSESVLALKDPSRAFPTGSALGVLKWRLQTSNDSSVPLLINCWPTQTGDDMYEVNVEYELKGDHELRDVRVHIPVPGGPPSGLTAAAGEANYVRRDGILQWTIPIIDSSNDSATVEFTASSSSPDVFFPIQVSFSSPRIMCDVEVIDVRSAENESPLPFSKQASLTTESYQIV